MNLSLLYRFYYSPLVDGGIISVDEAKDIISKNIEELHTVKLPLDKAIGCVLAEDVFSVIDFPPFNQSSVDGYAIAFKDVQERLIINGKIAAGNNENIELLPKHAMRIFTGAPVPSNADTVVMQEKTFIENGMLKVNDEQLTFGLNFRAKATDIQKGALALKKNTCLSAAAIGFLAGIGIAEVNVYKKPVINIIITGNELQQPGKSLQFGQVYEANSFMLKAALRQLHFDEVNIFNVEDDLNSVTSTLNEALNSADLVLLCGGISVGDYDFVLQAATDCGVEKLFHKVKQRPGKPLYFGKKEAKYIFGLPGNPSSVLTCFYEYVIPALQLMTNKKDIIKIIKAPLAKAYRKTVPLTFFLKGVYDGDKATPLDAQESYRLSSFAKANCLIRMEEDMKDYAEDDIVEVHLLPN